MQCTRKQMWAAGLLGLFRESQPLHRGPKVGDNGLVNFRNVRIFPFAVDLSILIIMFRNDLGRDSEVVQL